MKTGDVVTLIGIAVTFLVSVANLVYSFRNNRRTTFVNTVTASRLRWINSLRDDVAEFLAVTTRFSDRPISHDDLGRFRSERDTLLHKIVLHLNPIDEEDRRIKTLAHKARDLSEALTPLDQLSIVLIELRDATGIYLKKEWNRVKQESNG